MVDGACRARLSPWWPAGWWCGLRWMPEPGKVRPSIGPAPHTGVPAVRRRANTAGVVETASAGRRAVAGGDCCVAGLPLRLPPAIGLPTRSRIEGDARRAVDAGWRRWSPAQRQRCRDGRIRGEHHLVNRRAHLGARINRHRELPGHRRREHLPAATSPRPATASAGAQPPTTGNQPGSQAASEQCHARRRHRLPGNRQTRGSMRLVSVTVRPALHASPPRWRGRRRRRLSAFRPPPRPPAPVRTHSTGPTLQPPRGATPR